MTFAELIYAGAPVFLLIFGAVFAIFAGISRQLGKNAARFHRDDLEAQVSISQGASWAFNFLWTGAKYMVLVGAAWFLFRFMFE